MYRHPIRLLMIIIGILLSFMENVSAQEPALRLTDPRLISVPGARPLSSGELSPDQFPEMPIAAGAFGLEPSSLPSPVRTPMLTTPRPLVAVRPRDALSDAPSVRIEEYATSPVRQWGADVPVRHHAILATAEQPIRTEEDRAIASFSHYVRSAAPHRRRTGPSLEVYQPPAADMAERRDRIVPVLPSHRPVVPPLHVPGPVMPTLPLPLQRPSVPAPLPRPGIPVSLLWPGVPAPLPTMLDIANRLDRVERQLQDLVDLVGTMHVCAQALNTSRSERVRVFSPYPDAARGAIQSYGVRNFRVKTDYLNIRNLPNPQSRVVCVARKGIMLSSDARATSTRRIGPCVWKLIRVLAGPDAGAQGWVNVTIGCIEI